MQIRHPTPSCTRFDSAAIPCAQCGGEMRLALLEPHKGRLEVLTYTCSQCQSDEVFLISPK